ncbi:NAD(P)H-hydrate dehydratase [Weeksellaceae bacterium A-14]|uniref:NAD(P)H-hydrate dehydratase n=1 Tax=Daejeonia sp. YH14 TaxID=3439042 RepID=UPI0031E4D949
MKILTAEQIRECDQYTIKNDAVSSISLMERAAEACTEWISKNVYHIKRFNVFCGNGNNGGDGFAIARMLKRKGFYVKVFTHMNGNFSPEAAKNVKRIRENGDIEILDFDKAADTKYDENTCVIDALFGTGLNRKVSGVYGKVIKFLNTLSVHKISIDIPSGLFTNKIVPEGAVVFKADDTLSFQFWKRSFLHPETGKYAGNIHILDIKLNQEYIDQVETEFFVNEFDIVSDFFKKREDFTHKGRFGKSVLVAGSYGKMGAAVMAVSAALKSGSGLVYSISSDSGYHIMQSRNPEAMFIRGGEDYITDIEVEEDFTAGIGPGLGQAEGTQKALIDFLQSYTKPVVLDADALNILSNDQKLLKLIPKDSVITPHPVEFERLFGEYDNSYDRLEAARRAAEKYQIYIVLKDHRTQIVTPDKKVYYNITGNSGMSKGGSGDVLTGIVTSLMAQKYTSLQAALFGVWMHGKAGDYAAEKYSKEAMLPTNLINELSNVFKLMNAE